ncbi:MAG: hypothetical protein CV081_09410 [Nitrospira sp. LK265]|nr:hypothetical protein [Nitrospira sp. LK265]
MGFRHQGNGGHIPRGLVFLLAGNFLGGVTTFAGGFVGFNSGAMGSMIGHVHRSAAARLRTSEMFMLKGLNESAMSYPLLF